MGMNPFWSERRVLLTGHTGFKGSWLSLWLQKLGAHVAGYAWPPPAASLFELASIGKQMTCIHGDIRNTEALQSAFDRFHPEIVFHLAAQSLVRKSYGQPVETFDVNVMGTIHLFEAVRRSSSCRVVVNVTSDKCYQNKEWVWGYREDDAMGGRDPYSSSKACAELVTSAYRSSFFEASPQRPVAVASARAGNVIGGGDFAADRLVPDIMAAFRGGKSLQIRNPDAVRPWQHVLEPISGYLLLAERLWHEPALHAQAWNFGPLVDDVRPVLWIVRRLAEYWGEPVSWTVDQGPNPHEERMLALDSSKARCLLGWKPRWTLEQALRATTHWYKAYGRGEPLRDLVMQQIESYEALASSS
jgi:CDP-glucose 4,6-dehydratase